MNKVIILFLNKFIRDKLRFFSGNLFEVVVVLLYEPVQRLSFSYDLYSDSHHFDSSGQKRIANVPNHFEFSGQKRIAKVPSSSAP